ncbi:hypothetical protein BKA81DRAFT_379809 [Phyllosticta paracitricarpa]
MMKLPLSFSLFLLTLATAASIKPSVADMTDTSITHVKSIGSGPRGKGAVFFLDAPVFLSSPPPRSIRPNYHPSSNTLHKRIAHPTPNASAAAAYAGRKTNTSKCLQKAGTQGLKCRMDARPPRFSPGNADSRRRGGSPPDDRACTYVKDCRGLAIQGCGVPNAIVDDEGRTACRCPAKCADARAGFARGPRPPHSC